MSAPFQPSSIVITAISAEQVDLQWIISRVTYIPEIYTVMYGISSTLLNYTSDAVVGGSDITAINQVYSASLNGLQPSTTYYYQVVATNSAGSNSSNVEQVTTPLPSE